MAILAALRDAQNMKPRYDGDGLTAVYPLKTPIGGPRPSLHPQRADGIGGRGATGR
jgi:hypothetical protein